MNDIINLKCIWICRENSITQAYLNFWEYENGTCIYAYSLCMREVFLILTMLKIILISTSWCHFLVITLETDKNVCSGPKLILVVLLYLLLIHKSSYYHTEALKNAFLCILHMHTHIRSHTTTTYSPNLNTLG